MLLNGCVEITRSTSARTGILCAVIGGWIFGLLGISAGSELVGSLVTAVVGAVILLFIIGLVRKKA